jgi:hypothetical protein
VNGKENQGTGLQQQVKEYNQFLKERSDYHTPAGIPEFPSFQTGEIKQPSKTISCTTGGDPSSTDQPVPVSRGKGNVLRHYSRTEESKFQHTVISPAMVCLGTSTPGKTIQNRINGISIFDRRMNQYPGFSKRVPPLDYTRSSFMG